MRFDGIIIGFATFVIIGALHPVVIKAEYYLGTKIWPAFLVAGVGCLVLSILSGNYIVSTVFGVFAFSLLWCILELFDQKKRVEKGWFPANPNRKEEVRTKDNCND